MKNIHLLYLVVYLIPIVVISFLVKETNFILNSKYHNNTTSMVRVLLKDKDEVVKVDLEDYVIGVVAGEMPASFKFEALKAQAVAARSYALSKINNEKEYDVVNTASDQVYLTEEKMKERFGEDYDKYYNKIRAAIISTSGEVLSYDDKVIKAYYFSLSNGYTQNAITVFNENKTYLQTVDSVWDQNIKSNYLRTKKLSNKEFCKLLNLSDCNKISISDITKNDANYVNTILINNTKFYGNRIRKLLGLRSADFDIEINNNEVIITTRGFGHGVGMSQYGANEMAKLNYNYREILKHYYTNINIETL